MSQSHAISVLLSPNEFSEDLDLHLGRANGNVYHRRMGVEGVHDGQIMIRLKKKRFIVVDYGIVPNEADLQTAALNPHISCPPGAGKQKCTTPECTKVGVPVLLYDSEPQETASLYLRSGLCFTCQRNLNEKRRTQRKRKSSEAHETAPQQQQPAAFNLPSGHKKFKLNGEIIELSPDAIIINGSVDGAKHHGEGYGYAEIGTDLQSVMREASASTDRLISAVASASNGTTTADPTMTAFSSAAAAAAAPSTNEDITAFYHKSFVHLSKAMFLLSQWKSSWDSAVATAMAQETGLADAVASAAAVVAASDGQDQSMIPLLLAAESKGGKKKDEGGEVFSV